MLFEPYVHFHVFISVPVTEWGIASHSAYNMFSWYKYLSVILVFSPSLCLWGGNLFLIAPFPYRCLFVLFYFIKTLKNFIPCFSYVIYYFVNLFRFLPLTGKSAILCSKDIRISQCVFKHPIHRNMDRQKLIIFTAPFRYLVLVFLFI